MGGGRGEGVNDLRKEREWSRPTLIPNDGKVPNEEGAGKNQPREARKNSLGEFLESSRSASERTRALRVHKKKRTSPKFGQLPDVNLRLEVFKEKREGRLNTGEAGPIRKGKLGAPLKTGRKIIARNDAQDPLQVLNLPLELKPIGSRKKHRSQRIGNGAESVKAIKDRGHGRERKFAIRTG